MPPPPISPRACPSFGIRDGVHVNAIHPGTTATERTEQLLDHSERPLGQADREDACRHAGQERYPPHGNAPENIATLALFLCSERARHIQGTAITVNGGATPGLYRGQDAPGADPERAFGRMGMNQMTRRAFGIAGFALMLATSASLAQQPQTTRIRGQIEKVNGDTPWTSRRAAAKR